MPTTVTKIVDPDSGAGFDYSSLSLWNAGQQGDLTGARNEIAVAKCRSTGGTADTTVVDIDGWTTSATQYIKIWTDPTESYRHNGTYQTTKYRLETGSLALYVHEEFVWLDGLQFQITDSSSAYVYGIRSNIASATQGVIFSNSIIRGVLSGTSGSSSGQGIHTSDDKWTIYNCIFYDWVNSTNSITGIYIEGVSNLYNNTIHNCRLGISGGWAGCLLTNNMTQSCTTGFSGGNFGTNATNISEDATSPNAAFQNKVVVFVNEDADNFHLDSTDTVAINAGTDLSSIFTTDIDNQTRSTGVGTWDIGADEYVAAGGSVEVSATTDGLVLTEDAAGINAETNIQAGIDALVVTGNVATVKVELNITADVDALILTENVSDINAEANVQTGVDALSITTNDADIKVDRNVLAGVDLLVIAENTAGIKVDRSIITNTDVLVVTANIAEIKADTSVTANPDALVLTENIASIKADINIATDIDVLVLTENVAIISAGINIIATTDPLTLTGNAATVNAEINVQANVATLTITKNSATVEAGVDIDVQVATDTLALTAKTATVNAQLNFTTSIDALALVANIAIINAETKITADVDTLALTGNIAFIKADTNITTSVANLSLTGKNAIVEAEGNIDVQATTEALLLSVFSAVVNINNNVLLNHDSLILVAYRSKVKFKQSMSYAACPGSTDKIIVAACPGSTDKIIVEAG